MDIKDKSISKYGLLIFGFAIFGIFSLLNDLSLGVKYKKAESDRFEKATYETFIRDYRVDTKVRVSISFVNYLYDRIDELEQEVEDLQDSLGVYMVEYLQDSIKQYRKDPRFDPNL